MIVRFYVEISDNKKLLHYYWLLEVGNFIIVNEESSIWRELKDYEKISKIREITVYEKVFVKNIVLLISLKK